MGRVEEGYFCKYRVGGETPLCLVNFDGRRRNSGISPCAYRNNQIISETDGNESATVSLPQCPNFVPSNLYLDSIQKGSSIDERIVLAG